MWPLVPFIILFGVGYGGANALRPALIREYLGRAGFGTAFGFLMGVQMVGAIVGPILAGWVYDNWGAYQELWLVLSGLSVAAMLSIFTIPPVKELSPTTAR